MKKIIYFLIILVTASCNYNKNSVIINNEQVNQDSLNVDSILSFRYVIDIHDTCITNTTDNRRIDLLLSNVQGFLGGKFKVLFDFGEYMWAGDLIELEDGLLFCDRLLITKDGIKYFKNNKFNLKNRYHKPIKLYGEMCKDSHKKYRQDSDRFIFGNGKGTINYVNQFCQDANNKKVILNYGNGKIEINKIPDASFFEYDLDKDGINEQYVIGGAVCGPELVILRIVMKNDKN